MRPTPLETEILLLGITSLRLEPTLFPKAVGVSLEVTQKLTPKGLEANGSVNGAVSPCRVTVLGSIGSTLRNPTII